MKKKYTFFIATLIYLIFSFTNVKAQILSVPEIEQEQSQWCWAGATKCILDYYSFFQQQCIIAEYARTQNLSHFGNTNCCISPNSCNNWNWNWGYSGSMEDILFYFGGITTTNLGAPISQAQWQTEITNHTPFIIRIGWNSGGGHFVVGYGISGSDFYTMDPWFNEGYTISTYNWLITGQGGAGSWTHTQTLSPAPILGCTDSSALNFDSLATTDDGSCVYSSLSTSFIDTLSIEGISCNNDTGYIKLGLSQNIVIIEADEWQYQPYDSTNWIEIIDSTTFLSQNYDTLSTLSCGKYRVTVFNTTSGAFPDTAIFFVPCDLSVAIEESASINCFGDSSGILLAPTFGGIVFDPDSSTFDSLGFYFPNDTTGDEYYTYQWFKASNLQGANLSQVGDTTNTLTNVSAGIYNVVVTDAIGCRDTSNFVITNPIPISIVSSLSNVSANGVNDGSIAVSVTGGVAPYSFFWSNGLNTINIFNLSPGQYSLTVTDDNNCSVTETFLITGPSSGCTDSLALNYNPNATINDSSCIYTCSLEVSRQLNSLSSPSATDGSVFLLVDSGLGPFTYVWEVTSTGVTDTSSNLNGFFTRINLPADTYCLTITDSNGCTYYECYEITYYPCLVTLSITDPIICNNGFGTLQANIDTSGTGQSGGPYVYNLYYGLNGNIITSFTSYALTQQFPNLPSGFYILEVFDLSYGDVCNPDTILLTEPDQINISYSIINPSSSSSNDGSIAVSVSGGVAPYQYSWYLPSGLAITNLSISGLSSGTYYLHIIDSNGCSNFINIYLNSNTSSDSIIISNDTTVCNIYNDTLFALSAIQSNLNLDDGHDIVMPLGFTFNFYGQPYTNCVVSSNGYVTFDTSLANTYSPYSINSPIPNPGSIPQNAILAPWQDINPGINGDIYYELKGNYPNRKFVITFCQIGMFTCADSLTTTQVILHESTDKIEMFIESKPLCTNWNGGNAIQGLVNIGNTTADIVFDPFLLAYRNFPLQWSAYNEGWEFVPNGLSYLINSIPYVAINAGFNIWSDINNNILGYGSNLPINTDSTSTYYASLSGDCALSSLDSITITINNCNQNIFGCTEELAFNYDSLANCNDGSCLPFVLGCADPAAINYLLGANIDDGTCIYVGCTDSTAANYNPLASINDGTCLVITHSGFGCTDSSAFNYDSLANVDDGSCYYDILGCTDSTALNYYAQATLNDGSCIMTHNPINLFTFLDSINIINNSSCFAGAPNDIEIFVSNDTISNNTNCGDSLSNYQLKVFKQDTNHVISFLTSTNTSGNNYLLNGFNTGTYYVLLVDSTQFINAYPNSYSSFGSNSQLLYTPQSFANVLYQPFVYDFETFTISNTPTINTSFSLTQPSCFGRSDGSISALVTGGIGPYSFLWSNGDTTSIISNVQAGTYTCTVTDDNGCTNSNTVNLNEPNEIILNLTTNDISCHGLSDGYASINPSGGSVSSFSVIWSIGNPLTGMPYTSLNVSNIGVGTYNVVVTENFTGCDITEYFVITQPNLLQIIANELQIVTCDGGSDGIVGVDVYGGQPPFTYYWYEISNNILSTDSIAENLTSNTYYIDVVDSSGCSVSDSIFLNSNAPLNSNITFDTISCFGYNDGVAFSNTTGGTSPYTYFWGTTGSTSNQSTGLNGFNLYTIAITDANGCPTLNEVFTVPQPDSIIIYSTVLNPSTTTSLDGTIITDSITGGSPPYSYLWSTGSTVQNLFSLSVGNYILQISDNNYCIANSSFNLTSTTISGCTDSIALNYDSLATVDDSSCIYYSCNEPAPINVYVSNITNTRAKINWDNMNSPNCMVLKYVIRFREYGTNSWTTKSGGSGNGLCNFGLNNTSKVLRNLTPSTVYQYKMKAFYCNGGASGWTLPKYFTTKGLCPEMTNLTTQTYPLNPNKVTFSWDTTGSYIFARISLRENNIGSPWQTAGGFGVYFPQFSVNKFGLVPGLDYRAQGRTFCDSNITSYRSWWTPPIFWTQPNIRIEGGTIIKNLDIYPNPSKDIFNIAFNSEEIQDLSIRIINVVGAEIYREDRENFIGEYTKQVSLDQYGKGIYFLEIETNEGIINKKLILQ